MTIYYLEDCSTDEQIHAFLDEIVCEWFTTKFPNGFTPPQLYAIPSIHQRRNTLIFSSTGSGKTFAAFLAAINELFIKAKQGTLKNKTYILYISPLKALGNDIRKNLEEPLQGIQDLAAEKNIKTPKIRVATRTGDTTQAERNAMRRTPPHILITTPESLGLLLTSPKMSLNLKTVRWLMLDEIHEISNNKRGVLLSLFLEYLESDLIEGELTRIGLSATQAPIEEIARLLVGRDLMCTERKCYIANLPPQRRLDLAVLSPVKDLLHTPYIEVQQNIYVILSDLILDHETSIIFTNTRRGAESVAFKLKDFLGTEHASQIAVHHSSLSREIRLDVEDRLKNNELLAAISSTSLELGIDIGSVEFVGQVGSPKTVAKCLQRVGRSGHSLGQIAKGRLIVTDRDDSIECAVLNKSVYGRDIDKVQIPLNCLDVLAQFLVGISVIKRWSIDDAYNLIKSSYCYRNLSYEDYIKTVEYLGGYNLELRERKVYRKIWYDPEENAFGRKRSSRIIFYTNIGTIPENADYYVELETYRTRLGVLSETFVERLNTGDVFVLGSHTYQFKRTIGSRVIVGEAFGRRPTIPSWVGEELPRSFELSQQIGRFINVIANKLKKKEEDLMEWIISSFRTDEVVAKTIQEYVQEQLNYIGTVPSDNRLLIESFIDPQGRMCIIFHAYYGRRVNDALSRAYAYTVGNKMNCDVAAAVNDNGFILTLPVGKILDVDEIPSLVKSTNLERIIKKSILNTELFQSRFRHVANRGFMILRRSTKRSIPVSRQNMYAKRILNSIKDKDDFPIIKETYREILEDYMDLQNSLVVLKKIEKKDIKIEFTPLLEIPSPFAHGIVLLGSTDVVQISDRTALLRDLHEKVLAKVIGEDKAKETLFDAGLVRQIFNTRSYKDKNVPISAKKHLRKALTVLAPISTTTSLTPSIYDIEISDPKKVRTWIIELLNDNEFIEVLIGNNDHRTIPMKDYPIYWNVYIQALEPSEIDKYILNKMKDKISVSFNELVEKIDYDPIDLRISIKKLERAFQITRTQYILYKGKLKWKYSLVRNKVPKNLIVQAKKLDPEECLKKVIERYLSTHGPKTLDAITTYLAVKKEKIERALKELEVESSVLKGQIIKATSQPQYILLEDRELLRNLSMRSPDSVVLTNEELNYIRYNFTLKKYFTDRSSQDSIIDILEHFGFIEDLNSLIVRMQDFEFDWLRRLIKENKILQGRFAKNRVSYISIRQLPYFYVAYREPYELSKVEEKILETLKKYGPMTKRDLIDYTGYDSNVVHESLILLDKTLHIIRKTPLVDTTLPRIFSPNVYDVTTRYVDNNKLPSINESLQQVIMLFIKSLGPVSLLELTQISGFKYSSVERVIKSLLEKDSIIEKTLTQRKTNYYLTIRRFEEIKAIKQKFIYRFLEDDLIVIIPKSDPFTNLGLKRHLNEIYGDGTIDPIIVGGEIKGSIEYKLQRGKYLQVYNLKLNESIMYNEVLLKTISAKLIEYTRRMHKVLSLQIEDINETSILSENNTIVREIFEKAGYRVIKATLVGGESVTRVFKESLIHNYLINKMWLKNEGNTLTEQNLLRLIEDFGFLSFEEIQARFPGEMKTVIIYLLNSLIEKNRVYVQNEIFYSDKFIELRIAGVRKRRKLKEDHEFVVECIKGGLTSIEDMKEDYKGNTISLLSTIKTLEANMMIAGNKLDSNGKISEYKILELESNKKSIDITQARKKYVKHVLESLGIATEEQIVERTSIPSVLNRSQIKEIMTDLVDGEEILTGRFIEDALQFYFITKDAYQKLLENEKKENTLSRSLETINTYYILPPYDFAQTVFHNILMKHFSTSAENYCIVLNKRIIAVCKVERVEKGAMIIKDIQLDRRVNSEKEFNYIINAVESLKAFFEEEVKTLLIKRINNISLIKMERHYD